MKDSIKQNMVKAGILYLLVALTGGFAHFMMHDFFIVEGKVSATIDNIMESKNLYRLSILAAIICQSVFVFLVLSLYKIFMNTDRFIAKTMIVIALIGVPIAFINTLFQVIPLTMLTNESMITAHTMEDSQLYTSLLIELHKGGVFISQLFWGGWLFPLGYLVLRSRFMPKLLGLLLMLACFPYLVDSVAYVIAPQYNNFTTQIAMFSGIIELILCFWLILKSKTN